MATWNQNIGIANWQNRTNQGSANKLALSPNNDTGSYNLSLVGGNSVILPTTYSNLTLSSITLTDSGVPSGYDTLYAYGGELFFNGLNVISTISTSVLDWAVYPAVDDIKVQNRNIRDVNFISSILVNTDYLNFISSIGRRSVVSTINGNTAFFSSLSNNQRIFSDRLWVNSISSGSISTLRLRADDFLTSSFRGNSGSLSTLNTQLISSVNGNIFNLSSLKGNISSLAVSSLTGSYANGVSTSLGTLSNFSTTFNPTAYSNWSLYPAVSDVNANNYSINNIYNLGANTVNAGGITAISGVSFNDVTKTFYMNNKIQTGDTATYNVPNAMTQYFSNVTLGTNTFDIYSIFNSFCFTTTTINLRTIGILIPTGLIEMNTANYRATTPSINFPFYTTLDYRGSAYLGTSGFGAGSYVRMNYDGITSKIPNTAALVEINADTAYNTNGGLLGPSRITTTGGVNQNLGTFSNQLYAGYAQILAPYGFATVCAIDQWAPAGFVGGGIQTSRVNGGGLGSRNDMTAEGTANGYGTEMNIYSYNVSYVYTNGDLYLGYGGSVPRYGSNTSQRTHLYNAQDIVGYTDDGIGLNAVNVNSVQGYTSNSYIKNFRYLIGYDENFAYGNLFLPVPLPGDKPESTITYFGSTMSNDYYSTFNGTLYSTFYLSTMTFSTVNYFSSILTNERNISSLNSTIGQWGNIGFNYLQGISTILSSFILSVEEASITNISNVSNIYAKTISAQTLYVSDIKGGYADNISSFIGRSISTSAVSTASTWSLYPAISTVNMCNNNISNVNQLKASLVNSYDVYASIVYTNILGNPNPYVNTPIAVNNGFNLLNNNIFNVGSLTTSNISTIFISTSDVYTNNLYVNNLGNPNALVPTPIAINNALNLQDNDIFNGNSLTTSNISTVSISSLNVTTNVLSLYDVDDNAGIAFYDSNQNIYGAINNLGSNNLGIISLNDLTVYAQNTGIASSNTATYVALSTTVMYSGSTIRMIAGDTISLSASNGVAIEAPLGVSNVIYVPNISNVNNIQLNSQTSMTNMSLNNSYNLLYYTIGSSNLPVASDWYLFPANDKVDIGNNILYNASLLSGSSVSTNSISSGTFFTGSLSTLSLNTSSITTNTINGVNNILTLNGFISSQSIRASTIVSSNIFVSTIRATRVETNTGTVGSSNSAFDYVSTASVRTNILQPASGIGPVTTYSLTPIDANQNLGTFPTPFFFGFINNLSNNNLSSGTIVGGSINVSSVRANTITGTSTIFTSTLRATTINTNTGTAGVYNSAFDYVSTASIRTNTLQGATGSGSVITFSLQPINNTQVLNTNTNVPWLFAGITNLIGTNISTVSTTTNVLNASTIRTGFLQTTATRTLATNYLSTYVLKTDYIQGNAATGGSILFLGNPYPNTNNTGDMGSQAFRWNSLTNNFTSTQNLVVSTINFKPYPYTSTLNIFPNGVSTYSLSGVSAVVPQVLISNVRFPHLGNYLVTSKMTLTKTSGGAGQEGYPSLCLSRGLYPSTFSTDDGFNALPYINHLNLSTFNTYTTSISVTNPTQLTRFLTYYDQSGHTYTSRMSIADFRIRYIPSVGNNPDLGIS